MGSAKKKNAVTRIDLEGELTIYTAAELKEKFSASLLAGQPLAIDLSQVGEMDTAGLQLLLLAQRESAARQQPVTFLKPSQAVLDTLQLCGLSDLVQSADAAA
jgi:anti-anti-sigma factor